MAGGARLFVEVKVVSWGDRRWGIGATVDGGQTYVYYPVGARERAVAEAERIEAGGLPHPISPA
jgi:hypothetical protein